MLFEKGSFSAKGARMFVAAVFAVCFGMVLSGCVSVVQDPRLVVARELEDSVTVTDVRLVKGTGGYLTFQVSVQNDLDCACPVEWKVVWYDTTGLEIESTTSAWRQFLIQPQDIKGLQGTAPSLTAAQPRFYLRRAR